MDFSYQVEKGENGVIQFKGRLHVLFNGELAWFRGPLPITIM